MCVFVCVSVCVCVCVCVSKTAMYLDCILIFSGHGKYWHGDPGE